MPLATLLRVRAIHARRCRAEHVRLASAGRATRVGALACTGSALVARARSRPRSPGHGRRGPARRLLQPRLTPGAEPFAVPAAELLGDELVERDPTVFVPPLFQ